MTKQKNVPEHMTKPFDEARMDKWRKGINEHRGGDASAPFKGNRLEELAEEMYDATNYMEDDARESGDTNWSIEISFLRQTAAKIRAVYFRRLGL